MAIYINSDCSACAESLPCLACGVDGFGNIAIADYHWALPYGATLEETITAGNSPEWTAAHPQGPQIVASQVFTNPYNANCKLKICGAVDDRIHVNDVSYGICANYHSIILDVAPFETTTIGFSNDCGDGSWIYIYLYYTII